MKLALVVAAALATLPAIAHAQTPVQLRYICKQFVERTLHDPGGAELEGWTKASVTKDKAGHYVVRFPGRARNAYNALRLATFECVIRYDGQDNFTALSVKALP